MLKMESSANLFKNAIDKAYTTQPNVKLNTDTIKDAMKYKSGFTEEVEDDDDDFEYETFLDKRLKQSAKDQFKKDLQQDKDFAEFKKIQNLINIILSEHQMFLVKTHS